MKTLPRQQIKNVPSLILFFCAYGIISSGTSQSPYDYQLDSIWNPNFESVTRFFYNPDGSCARLEYAALDDQNNYLLEQQVVFTYTAIGLIDERSIRYWDDSLSMFVEFKKILYSYDDEDRLLQELTLGLDEFENVWLPLVSYEWEYNEVGDLVLYRRLSDALSWGELTENWRFSYTYSNDGLDFVELHQIYIGGLGLQNYQRKTHSTISDGLKEVLLETWEEGQWDLSTLTEATYEDGRLVEEFIVEYTEGDAWVNSKHNVYTYTDWQEHEATFGYLWSNDEWMHVYLEESIYDENQNLLSHTEYNWSSDLLMLSPSYINNYSYNESLLSNTAVPYYLFDQELHTFQPITLNSVTYSGASLISNYSSHYYYSEFSPLSVPEHDEFEVRVYPNPASDYIRFTTKGSYGQVQVVIRNFGGALVYDQVHAPGDLIPTVSMASGLYVYQIIVEDQQATGKIIIH